MYTHTQRSPLHLLLYLPVAFAFVFAWQIRNDTAPTVVVLIIGVLLLLLSLSFQTLTISDEGKNLEVRYGPLNIFGTRIAYVDIASVEKGTTSFIDGWGIHFVPFRGWTFNLWGFECAKISLGNSKVYRLGTNDADNLVSFLNDRLMEIDQKLDANPD